MKKWSLIGIIFLGLSIPAIAAGEKRGLGDEFLPKFDKIAIEAEVSTSGDSVIEHRDIGNGHDGLIYHRDIGNGGMVYWCGQKDEDVIFVDYFEQKNLLSEYSPSYYPLDADLTASLKLLDEATTKDQRDDIIHSTNLDLIFSESSIMSFILERLRQVDPVRANTYELRVAKFYDNLEFVIKDERRDHTKDANIGISYMCGPDSSVPAKTYVVVTQRLDHSQVKAGTDIAPSFEVDKMFWHALLPHERVGLILHEVIYTDVISNSARGDHMPNSDGVRAFNYLIASSFMDIFMEDEAELGGEGKAQLAARIKLYHQMVENYGVQLYGVVGQDHKN